MFLDWYKNKQYYVSIPRPHNNMMAIERCESGSI